MTQFTSSPAKRSHVSSSGRTKNCSAGFRQWAVQAAVPVLQHVFKWGRGQSHISLQQLCSTSRTIWATPCCSHGYSGTSCTQRTPGSWLQTRLGEHKTPRGVSRHEVKQISPAYLKDQLKTGQWKNWGSSPVLKFPTQANQRARKKLIRVVNNVPKCCVNILKPNIYSKVN